MTTKEKLQFFSEHGVSISYVAKRLDLNPSTLTKWLRDDKGITHKNEQRVNDILTQIIKELLSTQE